jgi:hypothetical protein
MAEKTEKADQIKELAKANEELASQVAALANAARVMMNGPMKRRAMLLLLADQSGVGFNTCNQIMMALEAFDTNWLREKN